MFKSLFELTKDVVDIAIAPVEIAVDVAREVTKPVAELAKDIVEEFKPEE